METTLLSTLLNRMNRWQSVSATEEQYLVRDLDEAIRAVKRENKLPWTIKKSTLRVFSNVLEYPVASDHDDLISIETDGRTYENKLRAYYTSLTEFYEDTLNRNMLAEIWDQGTRYLGVKVQDLNETTEQKLDSADDSTEYSYSGDITAIANETVFSKEGETSIKITIVSAATTATIARTFDAFSDTDYKKKYYFRWVYLPTAPTSLTLRYGTDSSNYVSATVTTQFSGQAFKAGDWNLVAMDLNTATATGTINTASFTYEALVFTGAASGTYYLDASYLREWALLEYWYYSTYNCMTTSASVPDQEYFYNSSEAYATDTYLVGDTEWADVIMYDALVTSITDRENSKIYPVILDKRKAAWEALMRKYPAMDQFITTHRWRFAAQIDEDLEIV